MTLAATLEALLFVSPDPVGCDALAAAVERDPEDVRGALAELEAGLAGRGLELRELAGGFALATRPAAEPALRRLLARPRTPPLSPAQAETLAIVAYLQPVSRPEISRIRGVNAESAAGVLLERGLIEEAGRSRFGAALYRTSELFLRLFGLRDLAELPEPGRWDPAPEVEGELRERLLRAGEQRAQAVAAS